MLLETRWLHPGQASIACIPPSTRLTLRHGRYGESQMINNIYVESHSKGISIVFMGAKIRKGKKGRETEYPWPEKVGGNLKDSTRVKSIYLYIFF